MMVTPAMTHGIEKGLPTTKLREIALQEGLVDLATAGMEQVVAGKTTIEEVFYKVSG
jgi:type IV pilus assembly protein PilB